MFLIHLMRGGGLGSRPKKMYGERLGDGVDYHLMSPKNTQHVLDTLDAIHMCINMCIINMQHTRNTFLETHATHTQCNTHAMHNPKRALYSAGWCRVVQGGAVWCVCSVVQCVVIVSQCLPKRACILQCVAGCCSVLRCFALWCSVLQLCCSVFTKEACSLQCVAGCCRVLQGVALCCRVLQGVAVWCWALQCDAVRCSVMQ